MPTLTRNTANIIAAILALALVGGMVIRTSTAFFTADTDNLGNSLAAGTIILSDDDSTTAMFTMTNVAPGEFAENCITVSYDGSLDPEAVQVYTVANTDATAYTTVPAATGPGTAAVTMEDQIRITIEEGAVGSGGTFDDCSAAGGFTAAAGTPIVDDELLGDWSDPATGALDYTTGTGNWDPSATGETKVYRVRLTLQLATDNTFQGASLTQIPIIWSTRSTATPGQVAPN